MTCTNNKLFNKLTVYTNELFSCLPPIDQKKVTTFGILRSRCEVRLESIE